MELEEFEVWIDMHNVKAFTIGDNDQNAEPRVESLLSYQEIGEYCVVKQKEFLDFLKTNFGYISVKFGPDRSIEIRAAYSEEREYIYTIWDLAQIYKGQLRLIHQFEDILEIGKRNVK